MSKDELIEEILRRVLAKIAECEAKNKCSSNACSPATTSSSCTCACESTSESGNGKDIHIDKRVLSERDVIDACTSGILTVYYSRKTIVTDLAKDYARAHKMQLVRE